MERASRLLVRAFGTVSLVALCVLVLLIAADVVGRKIGSPVPGANELVELALIITVSLSLAYTATRGAHVGIELILSRLSRTGRLICAIATGPLAMAGIGLVVWGATGVAVNDWQIGLLRSPYLFIPIAPFKFVVPLGFFLLALVLLDQWIAACSELLKLLRGPGTTPS